MSWYLLVFHLIGFFLTIYAAFQARTPQGLMAWGLALILFPYLGIPMFLLFGKSKLGDYDAIDEKLLPMRKKIENQVADFKIVDFSHPMEKFMVNSGAGYVSGNDIDLLVDARESYDSMLSCISEAKEFIFLQTYIFKTDDIGKKFAALFEKKAQEGVKVYLLYENLGIDMSKDIIKRMVKAGVHLGEFTPARFNKLQFNFRNHRKLMVVDGLVCFEGGLNIGDEYLGRDPEIGYWRDTNVRVQGPAVQLACIHFIKDWTWSQGEEIEVKLDPPQRAGNKDIFVLNSGPLGDRSTNLLQHLEMINKSTGRLWIANPYLVPPQSIIDSLMVAAIRGVDVRIIVPEKGDNAVVDMASELYFERLVNSGVRIFQYQKGMLHHKIVLVDECLALVGSANFDYRSMYINFENGMATTDPSFMKNLELCLREDFDFAKELSIQHFDEMSFMRKLGSRCLNSVTPVL